MLTNEQKEALENDPRISAAVRRMCEDMRAIVAIVRDAGGEPTVEDVASKFEAMARNVIAER